MPEKPAIKWDDRGLVPAIVQDAGSGQVLMMAWMNAEALDLTLSAGFVHFWSRSRQELWKKGETSGNYLRTVSVDLDCDGDTLLIRANPAGPACHTGETTCFHHSLSGDAAQAAQADVIARLFETIMDRKVNPKPGSYTNSLFDAGEEEILKKIGEESVEVILAAAKQGDERLVSELADLVYHGLTLLAARQLTPESVVTELASRIRS